jgi:periplasmic protein CpxP/Spy
MKKYFLALLAASLISIASFAAAQDSQSAPPPPANDQQGPPPGGRHHGPPDPAEHAQMLAKHLKLSADQQSKAQAIFETERTQMEGLRSDTTLSREDRRAKMMDIHKSSSAQVRALLDPGQQKKFDEMEAKRGGWGEGHHGDQQGPPPPPQQ